MASAMDRRPAAVDQDKARPVSAPRSTYPQRLDPAQSNRPGFPQILISTASTGMPDVFLPCTCNGASRACIDVGQRGGRMAHGVRYLACCSGGADQ